MIAENVYGHAKRLDWITTQVDLSNSIVEVGCGTGVMITLPLAKAGYDIEGVDLDASSIRYGRDILKREGIDENRLRAINVSDIEGRKNVIIASEVLEHLDDQGLSDMLDRVKHKLLPDGLLLVTVPNGYGWFEFESFLWFKTGLGRVLEGTRIAGAVRWIKSALFSCSREEPYPPSTLADSPHVQRFTYQSIQGILKRQGFDVVSATGSVLFAGPFSNLLFTGIGPIMKMNCLFGRWFPKVAAGFYLVCRPGRHSFT